MAGAAIYIGRGLYVYPSAADGLRAAALQMGANAASMGLLLLLIGRGLDASFGPLAIAALKFAAIAVGPSALSGLALVLLSDACLAVILAPMLALVIYWVSFALLFSLEMRESYLCVILAWLMAMISGILASGLSFWLGL